MSDHPLGAVPPEDSHGVVTLQAGLDQSAGNHFHLVEKRLVAPFLPLTITVCSPYGSNMWVKTRSLSKEARHRQWLLCPCAALYTLCAPICNKSCAIQDFHNHISCGCKFRTPPTHLTHFPLFAGPLLHSFCWSSGLSPAPPFASKLWMDLFLYSTLYSCGKSDLLYFGLMSMCLTWSGPLLLTSTTLDLADIIAASSCKR